MVQFLHAGYFARQKVFCFLVHFALVQYFNSHTFCAVKTQISNYQSTSKQCEVIVALPQHRIQFTTQQNHQDTIQKSINH